MTEPKLTAFLRKLTPHSGIILLAAVVLPRFLWFVYLGGVLPTPVRDQALYLHTAGRIYNGYGLSFSRELGAAKHLRNSDDNPLRVWTEDQDYMFGLAPVETPTAVMEPGYSVLLALFFRVFGVATGAVFALNLAFSLAGAFAVRKLVSDVWGPLSGMTASILWALYPPYVYYTAYAMTETAHSALLMISLCFLFSCSRGRGNGFLTGLFTGVFFLVRATALFLLPLEMAYLAWRRRWKSLLFVVLGFIAAVSPWVIRNAVELGSPVLMPTKGSLNLWMRNHPQVLLLEGIEVPEGIPVNSLELLSYPSTDSIPGELARSDAMGGSAREFMLRNPRMMLWLAWDRAGEFLSPGGGTLGARARTAGLLFYGILLFGAIGLWRNRKHPETIFLFAVFILYLLVHAAAHGGVRYRLPVDSVFLLGMAMCGCTGKDGKCAL
ncbi:MAG TPA: glycosyltransferase family 39 protein [Candidatus Sabulitectum sp.]|nr:glycosyltransferase family 39 protein [Candidatus Sabulitectum sp.]HPJ29121.1 glycosyltransferase family 39 protein [Candidatus Sabulitectum sp.]HPR22883.1 glycosyltransferase family 39 protein [Candidatus Sabulitectum sp.]